MDEAGEHWTGRELQPLMEYSQWRDFAIVIEKAKASLTLVQGAAAAEANFADLRKKAGQVGRRAKDYRLTRFAAYLTAMAGDDTKDAVAHARVYFAVRTHEAETAEAARQVAPKLSNRELAAMVIEEADRADRATARAEIAEGKFQAIEAGDGLTLTAFHKKYFSEVTERTFFEHLYSRGYLIDQRGKGSERENGTFRDGPEHRHPTFKGKPFFYLHGSGVHGKRRRENTRVRPGDPELLLKAALVKDGLRGNQHTVGHLFAIEGGAS
ncbi:hypothetical protein [Nonomuraea turkmeniaca]|uniref:hypothetical protein n=1 Tax=Nonomuraea turkmeniaca TaxID=103838 RepID=UPI001B872BB1|nr:hypothetical protein [Nonomuraea turkmeniaca]